MIIAKFASFSILMLLVTSCSGGDTNQTKKRALSPQEGDAKDGNGESTLNSGEGEGGALEKDCLAQWDLTVKQSPVGAKFVYKSSVKTMFVAQPMPFERIDEIKSSTPELIGHINSVKESSVATLIPGLNGQYVEISKKKFVKACQKFGTQAGAASALGKEVRVTEQSDETLSIAGKEIKVKKLKIEAKGLKFGSATADGEATIYISKQFPALILKQHLVVTDSNLPILEGVEVNEELKSGLPAF